MLLVRLVQLLEQRLDGRLAGQACLLVLPQPLPSLVIGVTRSLGGGLAWNNTRLFVADDIGLGWWLFAGWTRLGLIIPFVTTIDEGGWRFRALLLREGKLVCVECGLGL